MFINIEFACQTIVQFGNTISIFALRYCDSPINIIIQINKMKNGYGLDIVKSLERNAKLVDWLLKDGSLTSRNKFWGWVIAENVECLSCTGPN